MTGNESGSNIALNEALIKICMLEVLQKCDSNFAEKCLSIYIALFLPYQEIQNFNMHILSDLKSCVSALPLTMSIYYVMYE